MQNLYKFTLLLFLFSPSLLHALPRSEVVAPCCAAPSQQFSPAVFVGFFGFDENESPAPHLANPSNPPAPASLLDRLMLLLDQTSVRTLALIALIYFLPSIIGFIRSPYHLSSLVILNVFLGWTVIGWVIALALSFGDPEFEELTPAPPPIRSPRQRIRALATRLKPGPGFLKPPSFRHALSIIPDDSRASRPIAERITEPTHAHSIPSWPLFAQPLPNQPSQFESSQFEAFSTLQPAKSLEPNFQEPNLQPAPTSPLISSEPAPNAEILPEPTPTVPLPVSPHRLIEDDPHKLAPPLQLTWTEFYQPHRIARIEYAESANHYTVYDIALSYRGSDPSGREYLGAFSGNRFLTFRADRVLRTRTRNAGDPLFT